MGNDIIHNGFYKKFEGEDVVAKLMETECCKGGYCVSAFLLSYADFFAYSLRTEGKSTIEGLLDRNGEIIHYYRLKTNHHRNKAFLAFVDARGETEDFREFVEPFYTIRAAEHAEYGKETSRAVDEMDLQIYLTKKYDEATWDELCHSFAALMDTYGYWHEGKL